MMINKILIVRYGYVVHYCHAQSYCYLLSLYQVLESSDDDLPPLPPPMPTLEELKKASQSGAHKVHLHVHSVWSYTVLGATTVQYTVLRQRQLL